MSRGDLRRQGRRAVLLRRNLNEEGPSTRDGPTSIPAAPLWIFPGGWGADVTGRTHMETIEIRIFLMGSGLPFVVKAANL